MNVSMPQRLGARVGVTVVPADAGRLPPHAGVLVAVTAGRAVSACPVYVGAVIDAYDVDGSGELVNPIDHPIGAASCGVVPG